MNSTLITYDTSRIKLTLLSKWVADRNMVEDVLYDWAKSEITFYNEPDAIAFAFAFQVNRKLTKIEQMIRHEDSNN